MSVVERFTTADVMPRDRLNYWNRLCGETLDRTLVDTGVRHFRAQMLRWSISEMTMLRPRSDASVVRRAPLRGQGRNPSVVLHFQHFGSSRFSQGARRAELSAGDFILSEAEEGYCFELSPNHELLVVEMPRGPLAERLPGLEANLGRRLDGAAPGGRLCQDFLLSLWRQGDCGAADADWHDGVATAFYDLIALAVRGSETPTAPDPSGLRQRLLAVVEARLCDADLRTATLAGELGVSSRTVQNVFARMATTPSAYILKRRLQRAGDELRLDPGRSITSIAYDLGFNDSAYFARCFRREFGITPRSWRGRA